MKRLVRHIQLAALVALNAALVLGPACTCEAVAGDDDDDDDGGEGEGEGAGEGEGEGEGDGEYTPPAGPYVLVSPVVNDQASEDDSLVAADEFTAQVRVGNVSDISAVGFVLRWDPALITHVSRERIDAWLTSEGGTVLPLTDNLDDVTGELTVGFGVAGGGVSTATSEAIYEITFDFVGGAAATSITPDLSQDGLVQEGAQAPVDGVTVIALDVSQ